MRPLSNTIPDDTQTSETGEAAAVGLGDRPYDHETYTGLPSGRAALTVKEFCHWAGVSRSTFYNLVERRALKVRKIGNRTVVLCGDALAWLGALPEGAEPVMQALGGSLRCIPVGQTTKLLSKAIGIIRDRGAWESRKSE